MGRTKDEWMEAQERGWSAPGTYVCPDCIAEDFLRAVIEGNLIETQCSYCGGEVAEPVAAPLEEVMPFIADTFFQHYQEPGVAGLPRDSGEWVGEERIIGTAEALMSLDLPVEAQLFEDICNAFHNTAWIPAPEGWWLGEHEHERLKHAWDGFVEKTKHSSRYFFLRSEQDAAGRGPGYDPAEILEIIGQHIDQFDLWRELPRGQDLYRARRVRHGGAYREFHELSPPPAALAAAGRMNPPGISYGYFALDGVTAVLEVSDPPPARFSLGSFSLREPLLAVDLTGLRPLPSVFDVRERDERDSLIFLHSFVEAISVPVSKDGREHVEYVPSQIVCEYLAQVLRLRSDEAPGALLYPSAVDPGQTNIVIFPPRVHGVGWETIVDLSKVQDVTLSN